MMQKLPIPGRFLFRMELSCMYKENLEDLKELPPDCEFPDFESLEAHDSDSANPAKSFRVRGAWNENGLAFQFLVSGKCKEIWCNLNRPDESDRIELWLDTRNVHDVHRASRYCHRLICLPYGDGPNGEEPTVIPFPINRAKQFPSDIPKGSIRMKSQIQRNCYSLYVYFSEAALTGFDPAEFQDLGINWALVDRDFPIKTLTAGSPFPFMEDPSMWYTLHLARN
ncbi:MAG: hypothetical protein K6C40_05730 [Thermoguttaceae bacterium]|nr:hypothetical protein [Thermoguttaceae bacterium]